MTVRVMGETWEDVLTALERDLAAVQAVIDDLDHGATVTGYVPPPDLGPMPPELARRAIGLAAAYDAALERTQAEAARVADELRRLPRTQAEQGPNRPRVEYHS
jgi:hypothetical protein